MKKLILFIAFIGLTFSVNAQSDKLKDKAASDTEYVHATMKLSDVNKIFLYKSLLTQYDDFATKSKGLSKEEKKVIRKEESKALREELKKNFSKDEIKQINSLIKEKRQKDKK